MTQFLHQCLPQSAIRDDVIFHVEEEGAGLYVSRPCCCIQWRTGLVRRELNVVHWMQQWHSTKIAHLGFYDRSKKYNNYIRQKWHLVGYVLTEMCSGTVGRTVAVLLSSIVVFTQNGNFWVVPLLHSVSGMISLFPCIMDTATQDNVLDSTAETRKIPPETS